MATKSMLKDKTTRWWLHAAISTRRFFVSAKGYIGLIPDEAAEGDLICILNGGAVPYVLQRSPSEKDDAP